MDLVTVSVIVWATDSAPSWTVVGGVVIAAITALGGLLAWHSNTVANKTQHELDGYKLSMDSMEKGLAAANARADRAEATVGRLEDQIVTIRAELDQVRAEQRAERLQCAEERRQCADRVKVLVNHIESLGGRVNESDGEDDD